MSPNNPRDELLERYEQAKTQLPDGLPEAPSAATRERIMQAARHNVTPSATISIANRADFITAIGSKSLKNTPLSPDNAAPDETTPAANDSFWSVRAVASLAVMGLSALLWWQFENGTPEEQQAATSAQPAAVAAPAPTAPAPMAAPPASAEIAPTKSDRTIAQAPVNPLAKQQIIVPTPSIASSSNTKAAAQETAVDKPPAAPVNTPVPRSEPPSLPTALANTTDQSRTLQAAPAPRAEATAAARSAAPTAQAILMSTDSLFLSIEERNPTALRQALKQGISPNARTSEGNPALQQAVIRRWADGVRILLAAGADRSAKNTKGHTAYDVALELGSADMAELLAAPK